MHFITPIYFGLSLFLLGVIIFYLFHKEYTKQIVPSTLLWLQMMREWQATKWWRKLKKHLLLYLQLLILACLMFALTRPFVGHQEFLGEHVIVVIDTSASMTAREGNKTRLQLAKEKASEMIDQLDHQKMTMITAERSPSILVSNEMSKRKLQAALKKIKPSFESTDMKEAIQLADQLLTDSTGEIHVFSDQIKSSEIPTTYLKHSVTINNIGISKHNVSLRTFGVANQGGKINGIVSVYNEMDQEQSIMIRIEYDGVELTRMNEVIKPKKQTQLHIQDLPKKPYYKAVIDTDDDYMLDNVSFAFLASSVEQSFYLVGDVNPFMTKALAFLGKEMIQIHHYKEIPNADHAVYILSSVPYEYWPDGPSLILSPYTGEPFAIKEKLVVKGELEAMKDDPILRFVNLDGVYIQKSYPFKTTKIQSIVTSSKTPIIGKGYYEGHPLVLLGFDIEDTDWPLHPSFPIFLYNALHFLTEQQELLGYVEPNEQKEINFSADVTESMILNEENEQVSKLNLNEAYITAPSMPGLYKVLAKTNTGTKERLFAVTLHADEKTITPEKSFTLEAETEDSNETKQENPNEIWPWFVLSAFLLLLLEWEVYRRGISS